LTVPYKTFGIEGPYSGYSPSEVMPPSQKTGDIGRGGFDGERFLELKRK